MLGGCNKPSEGTMSTSPAAKLNVTDGNGVRVWHTTTTITTNTLQDTRQNNTNKEATYILKSATR